MFKTAIAACTAATLIVTPIAAQAQDYGYPNTNTQSGFDHESVATALFGLLLLGVVAKTIDNSRDDTPKAVTPSRRDNIYVAPRNEPRRIAPDRGGLRNNHRDPVVTRSLPASCLTTVDTRRGDVRMYGRQCLQQNYARFHSLPNRCAIHVRGPNRTRHGFDPQCLRNAGFVRNRHR